MLLKCQTIITEFLQNRPVRYGQDILHKHIVARQILDRHIRRNVLAEQIATAAIAAMHNDKNLFIISILLVSHKSSASRQ